MHYRTVVCLDDLARETFWPAKEFIYDLVRLPVHLASGIDIAKSPRGNQRSNLREGFDAATFLALVHGRREPDWSLSYFGIPDAAADYLVRHLPANALVLSYEMPPWLRRVLDAAGVDWIDLRVAPLRFGSDLYMGIATSAPAVHDALQPHSLREDEMLAEAGLLAAKLRYRLRYRDDALAMWGRTIYVGQTGEDASLLHAPGRYLRVADVADELRRYVGDQALLYKPHPYAGPHAEEELRSLQKILGYRPALCHTDTYDLLAGDARVRLVGISSGALQEAGWFGQETCSLMRPLCEPAFGSAHDPQRHTLVASHTFLSEPLWADLLGAPRRARPLQLAVQANRLRELHNTWWSYSTTTIRDSIFYKELFEVHAGADRENVAACRQALGQARDDIAALRREIAELRALAASS